MEAASQPLDLATASVADAGKLIVATLLTGPRGSDVARAKELSVMEVVSGGLVAGNSGLGDKGDTGLGADGEGNRTAGNT